MKRRIRLTAFVIALALAFSASAALAAQAYGDVKESDWFYADVMKATELGIFEGSDGLFMPDNTLTRAQMAVVLSRLYSKDRGNIASFRMGSERYSDIPAGVWYDEAVGIISELGIAEGTGEGCFSPFKLLTREQFAVMLYNYTKVNGLEGRNPGESSGFEDSSQISAWAIDAMDWAVSAGVLRGSGSKLLPEKPLTRAEAAAAIVRWTQLKN